MNAETENGTLILNGEESYVSTPVDRTGAGSTLTFDITLTEQAQPGDILFEADAEYGTFNICIMEDGTLGFTREGYDYSFGYTLPTDRSVTLSIQAKEGRTVLEAEGQTYSAEGSYTYEGNVKASGLTHSAMSLPVARIGSKINAVAAEIDNISLYTDIQSVACSAISPETYKVTTDNENPRIGSEGPVTLAFDKDTSTFWHTQYEPNTKPLPAEVVVELQEEADVNGFYYLPRQEGPNGHIGKYSLYYESKSGEWVPLVEEGIWEKNSEEKAVTFDAVTTSKIKLVVLEGEGGFASAAEFRVLAGTGDFRNEEVLTKIDEMKRLLTESVNTEARKAALREVIAAVEVKAEDATLVEENLAELEAAYEAFMEKEEGKVRIASFNIAAGKIPDVDSMRKQLEKYNVDIAGLQEVDKNTGRNPYDMLEAIQGDVYTDTFYSKAIDYQGGEYGIGMISKVPLAEETTTMLESGGNEQRVYQRAAVEIDGHKVAFYNTHLSYEDTELRHRQMNTIKEAMDADPMEYKILTGDFNTDQYREEFEEVFGEEYNIANGMNGIFFDTFNGIDDTMQVHSVDNVITTKNMEMEVVQMIDNQLSDHNMFFADLTFKEDGSVETADKTRLNLAVAMAEKLEAEQQSNGVYTEETWEVVQKALDQARMILEKADATQEEVDNAYDKLAEAMVSLVRVANKSELFNALNKAEEILANAGKYIASSMEGLQEAKDVTQHIYEKDSASRKEIEEALTDLINQILEVRILGDVNMDNKVDSADAQELLCYSGEMKNFSQRQLEAADVNGDAVADSSDAAMILQYAAEVIAEF